MNEYSNDSIAGKLDEISNFYQLERDDFRMAAYRNAANAIRAYPQPINNGQTVLTHIKGVGISIAKDVNDLLTVGYIPRLAALQQRYPDRSKVVEEFSKYYGIGPDTANKFYDAGYRTVDELLISGQLHEAQKLGIQYYPEISQPISRDEMNMIVYQIGQLLNPIGIKWDVLGSYRRGEKSSRDIDLAIRSDGFYDLAAIINILQPLLKVKLSQGPVVYRGIMRLSVGSGEGGVGVGGVGEGVGVGYIHHRIDVFIYPPSEWAFAVLHYTGSAASNTLLSSRANQFGWTLNQKGLFNADNYSFPANSEEDIYAWLRVYYMEPWQRIKTLDTLQFY